MYYVYTFHFGVFCKSVLACVAHSKTKCSDTRCNHWEITKGNEMANPSFHWLTSIASPTTNYNHSSYSFCLISNGWPLHLWSLHTIQSHIFWNLLHRAIPAMGRCFCYPVICSELHNASLKYLYVHWS